MNRFYVDKPLRTGDTIILSEEDSHHAAHVLRLTSGTEVQLMDGQCRFLGVIRATAPLVTTDVGAQLASTEPQLRITLYQGLPKGDKMELIVQKAVELGAERIVPVAMERSVVKLKGQDGIKKQQRWQKIAVEAGKQSGRCSPAAVEAPLSFGQLLQALPGRHDAVLVPWEEETASSLNAFAAAHPKVRSLGVLIGPEGGISPGEMHQLRETGAHSVTLGPRILRTETAGLATLAALLCLYGEMG